MGVQSDGSSHQFTTPRTRAKAALAVSTAATNQAQYQVTIACFAGGENLQIARFEPNADPSDRKSVLRMWSGEDARKILLRIDRAAPQMILLAPIGYTNSRAFSVEGSSDFGIGILGSSPFGF